MKSILKKVAGVALIAVLALGMFGCSSGSSDDPVKPPVISTENIPVGFVKVKGITITGNESWTPDSSVFVSGRSITIPDMYVCDHEVTRGEFKEVMGTDPSTASAYDKDGNKLTGDAVLNNPVNYVNWYDAIAYCNKLSLKENLTPCYSVSGVTDWENLAYSSIPTSSNSTWNALTYNEEADGYRLPTEAEWEWLARGGENYTYAGSNTVGDVAWYTTNTNDTGTREVKTKKANGYGLYDMSGNVYEWCYDWFGSVSSSTADTGASSGSSRVRRGGSWCINVSYCQVSSRSYDGPLSRDDVYGFRVVRSSSK
ncbi:formylglycine-generating enzyme family protein [Treponema sp.]|uniref:formylglycine-generating enzyme family protein n=1 Tax=Treponema sp. TaxID=166 RepID=UPI002A841573|nr:formylglycine-generating enzyme family protein [Treponema sp.]MDY4132729.1 formylglycine-generating enzyme family protein [Treponema sp.]